MPVTATIILTSFLAIVVLILGFALLKLFRWKVAFDGKEIVAFPSNSLDSFSSSLKQLEKSISIASQAIRASADEAKDSQSKIFDRVQALLKVTSETRTEFRTLRDDLDRKAAEIERLKVGYDTKIVSQCLNPVIASHVLVRRENNNSGLTKEHRQFVELLLDKYADLFESMSVQIETPEPGKNYRDARYLKIPPRTRPALSET
ncbi:MAG: hypothetical protein RLN96_03300, partial [Pseudomonadales bacterium]